MQRSLIRYKLHIMSERISNFLDTLTNKQKDFLRKIYNFEILKINWDIDQVLAETEVSVKSNYDKLFGTKFLEEKFLDSWNPITEIAKRSGHLHLEKVQEAEERLWSDPEVLFQALPNIALRRYSLYAHVNGIEQSVTTSRVAAAGLRTSEWVLKHYYWLNKEDINQNQDEQVSGVNYKLNEVLRVKPDVHFEDSVKFMRLLNNANPNIGIIGFPYGNDDLNGFNGDNVIMFPDRETFLEVFFKF